MTSAICFNLDQSKILLPVNGSMKRPILTHSHTMTPIDAPGKQAFSHSVFYPFG